MQCRRGVISPEQAVQLTEHDAVNLIFEPNVSTAAQVTEVSGRGVGMDIVSAVISRLKGSISIHTESGVGTTFRLRLPLTLAIIKALLFHTANRLYAVPLGTVLEITRAFAGDIHMVEGHEVLRIREEAVPLIRIGELSGQQACEPHLVVDAASAKARGKCFVVVVSVAERKFGLGCRKTGG